jgi:hypothetical protein
MTSKVLIGEWLKSGEVRPVASQAVNFRLDARYDHWLHSMSFRIQCGSGRELIPMGQEAASDDKIFIRR